MKPILFLSDKDKTFYDKIKNSVNKYFTKKGVSEKGNKFLYIKSIILIFIWLSLFLTILFFARSLGFLILLYIMWGISNSLIGFNIMHDGAHGSYSKKKWLNNLMGYTMNILGSDVFLWKVQHNVLHHSYTNVDEFDNDINAIPVLRLHPNQIKRWFHRYQYIYFVIIYGISIHLKMYFHDFQHYFTKKIGNFKFKSINLNQHIVFWSGKLMMISIYFLLPGLFIGFGKVIVCLLIMYFVMGVFLSIIFQLAHVVEKTEKPIQENNMIDSSWVIHELETTANFAMNNKVWTWILGGLNFQIEHHLFPSISHIHYPAISKIIQKLCKEFSVNYNSYDTFKSALLSHIYFLKKIGRN